MNFDRYTERQQQVLQLAQETAIRMGHQQIDEGACTYTGNPG